MGINRNDARHHYSSYHIWGWIEFLIRNLEVIVFWVHALLQVREQRWRQDLVQACCHDIERRGRNRGLLWEIGHLLKGNRANIWIIL